MNTFGLHSINNNSFNLRRHTTYIYPQDARNVLVTVFRVHNLLLNILGYLGNKVSVVSGCVRIATGFGMIATTLLIGERNAQRGNIIQHWYNEAILTGIAQISRGILEAFVSYGRAINATLDIISTAVNMTDTHPLAQTCVCNNALGHHDRYPDPAYPFPLSILELV